MFADEEEMEVDDDFTESQPHATLDMAALSQTAGPLSLVIDNDQEHFSQPSTQASEGLHYSTPAESGCGADSQRQFENHPEDAIENESVIKKDKYTCKDVKVLLENLDSVMDTAEEIVNTLIGGNRFSLNSTGDIVVANKVVLNIFKKLHRFKNNLKDRKFRKHPELLETTFLKAEDYEFLQRSHFSFKDSVKDEDQQDESDVHPVDHGQHGDLLDGGKSYRWKPLTEVKDPKYRRARTQEDFEDFEAAAGKQGVEMAQLAGYFIQKKYYHSNRWERIEFSASIFSYHLIQAFGSHRY